ncbi:MAG: lipopolysaccharide kinase InaA family protein [Gemmataceae bacterium]
MPLSTVVFRPPHIHTSGWVQVNPAFASRFAALGLDSATGFLELPGEVVSGHPDRHVLRVVLPGETTAFYLKRQHSVSWRERLRNNLAGFGWSSRCIREAKILKELQAAALPGPRWAAFGEDTLGRAFLLVEEVDGAVDLRQLLSDNTLSLAERRRLATHIGKQIARVHDAGFTTPDLTAKHVLISPEGGITFIDWQSARRVRSVPLAERLSTLAALHASVAEELATPRERLRTLRAAGTGRFTREVEREAAKHQRRRSIRDQRQPVVTPSAQRLVWVAGEAVCTIPEVAAMWPAPAIAPPFYGCESGTLAVKLSDGRKAVLIRGRSFTPLARLRATISGRSWRSPGANVGRMLFHLERYGVPAPRLLAFGQRLTGAVSAEWFALHDVPAEPLPAVLGPATAEQLGRLLRQLHDASCRLTGNPLAAFGLKEFEAVVRDVTGVCLVRKLAQQSRARDLARLVAALPRSCRSATEAGYHFGWCSHDHNPRARRVPVAGPATSEVRG